MPEICDEYLEVQSHREGAILPPTRFIYIAAAATWQNAFFADVPPLADLRVPGAPLRDPR